jgi:hypothetical protein
MSKRKKIAASRDRSEFYDGLVLRINPPEKFLQVRLINEIEFEASGEAGTIESIGPCFFYRLDSELQALLSARKPDFVG